MGKPLEYDKEHVLEAIHGSGAIVSTVARRLGCRWNTARKYIDAWEETRQAYKDEEETILDLAESTLYQSIKGADVQSAKWILSRKGRKRGYGDEDSGAADDVDSQLIESIREVLG